MLCVSGDKCIVHTAKTTTENKIRLENYIRQKLILDVSMDIFFAPTNDALTHVWMMKLETKTR